MALSERARSTIYRKFEPVLGEEVVGEMLSYFPARDVEEPATKEFVRAEIAGVRAEVAGVRAEIAELRATIHHELRLLLQWLLVGITAIVGAALAAARLLF